MVKEWISLIVLTYRFFSGIYNTLDSIFEQDYPSIELIISDDGSPDSDEELKKIEKYINDKKKKNIVNVIMNRIPENVGTVQNLNRALQLANGEYLKTLGGDDVLNGKDALSRYKSFLDNSGCLICFSKIQGIDEKGKLHHNLASCENDYDLLRKYSPEQMRNRLYKRNCLPAPGWFAKRELFEKYGDFGRDTRLIEDYPYWIFLCMNNVKFAFLDNIMVTCEMVGVSSGGHYSMAFMNDLLIIYDKFIFPYDRRFGVLQPFYNGLKKMGLGAYIVKAEWNDYNFILKCKAILKYWPFFIYIRIGELSHSN